MVFVDTDVLSTFSKIQRLQLLFDVFNQDKLNIATAVENEIKVGISKGYHFGHDIVVLQKQKRICIHQPIAVDHLFMGSLPQTLGAGERESVAICKRLKAILASNERRVKHHCKKNQINCINLAEILRAFWEQHILTQSDVRKIINEIETKDRIKFRTIDPIFN